jgi:hypothetical protein
MVVYAKARAVSEILAATDLVKTVLTAVLAAVVLMGYAHLVKNYHVSGLIVVMLWAVSV